MRIGIQLTVLSAEPLQEIFQMQNPSSAFETNSTAATVK